MMDSATIFDVLSIKGVPEQPYEVFMSDDTCYFGKDQNNNVVFMIPSQLTNAARINQETKSLKFEFNKKCVFRDGNDIDTKVVHMLVCKENTDDKVKAFIRLTKAFAQSERDDDQYYLVRLFSAISGLFDKKRTVSEMELQGLFAELFTILYLRDMGCDISDFWQSKNMMKFDFSFSEKKRLEIKSTLKSSRTHHFRHDQLLSELYDIRVASLMLRKSDFGTSLKDIVEIIRNVYSENYALLMRVESLISHVDVDMLQGIKYDEIYLREQLRFYDAKNIPHFNEKTPEGVFNAEYDCCLDTVASLDVESIIDWIKER